MFIGFKQEKKPVNYEILKILLRHSLSASASNDSGTTLDLVLFLCRLIFFYYLYHLWSRSDFKSGNSLFVFMRNQHATE